MNSIDGCGVSLYIRLGLSLLSRIADEKFGSIFALGAHLLSRHSEVIHERARLTSNHGYVSMTEANLMDGQLSTGFAE